MRFTEGIKRIIQRLDGSQEIVNTLQKEVLSRERIIRSGKYAFNIGLTTGTSGMLAKELNEEYNLLKRLVQGNRPEEETRSLRGNIETLLDEYRVTTHAKRGMHISSGSETDIGSVDMKILNHRWKKMSPEDATYDSKVNSAIGKNFQEVVFSTYAGKYLLSDKFEGEKLFYIDKYGAEHKAPLEIILRHLDISIRMTGTDLGELDVVYKRQDYNKKILEILSVLDAKYHFGDDTEKEFLNLKRALTEYASVPFFDNWLENAKYSGNIIKEFDWTKSRLLVTPVFEAIQMAYQYGTDIDVIRAEAKKGYSSFQWFSDEKFEYFWDLGATYYLARQLYNCNKENRPLPESQEKKYLSLVLHENFKNDAGRLLQRDARKIT